MVDLHDSLRPTGTAPPLPVSEIATRGRRRKRRRLVSTTGLAVATIGVAAFAISSLPRSSAETVTVADVADDGQAESADTPADDGADRPPESTTVPPSADGDPSESPTTAATATSTDPTANDEPPAGDADETSGSMEDTDPTTASTTQADTASEEAESAEPHPMTTPGIRTSIITTSEWEDGYCIQVTVGSDTVNQNGWQVAFDLDGTIATTWNATVVEASSGTFVFSGLDGYNADIRSGSETSFGTCVDTNVGDS